MSQADDIRNFVLAKWVTPARDRGQPDVTVGADDVHRDMGLTNAYPAVCSAIGSEIFAKLAGVKLADRQGPANGANVFWTFALEPSFAIAGPGLERLKAIFLKRYPDFPTVTFAGQHGGYWDEERSYKQKMLDRARETLAADPPLSKPELARSFLATLLDKPSNLLNWRVIERLDSVRNAHPGVIESATGDLVNSMESPAAAVAQFVSKIWPVYAEGQESNLPYADLRAIPTMLLALAKPNAAIPVRYQRFFNAGITLLHRPLFANQPLTEKEYADVLTMAKQIFEIMRDDWQWNPRDLWDVQGFIWATCKDRSAVDDSGEQQLVEKRMVQSQEILPTNLIFYGPPGTGKTYLTAEKAVELCDGVLPKGGRSALMSRYRELVSRKRIDFVTFHQSYSYEDFVEGLRPETDAEDGETGGTKAGFRLVPRSGVFKSIADRARLDQGAIAAPSFDAAGREVFKMSLGRSASDEEAYLYEEAIKGGYILLGYGGEIDWSDETYEAFDTIKKKWQEKDPEATGQDPNVQQIYALRTWMKVGDLVIVSDGNKRFRAIGEVTGSYHYVAREHDTYHHQRNVKWLWVRPDGLPREEIYDKGFSQVSIYRLNSDYLKREALAQIISGGHSDSGDASPPPYVLIIDEINRANISKVFGELISLIEADKRLGMQNELTVRLPYSGSTFGVPSNLHIVGTMNTADRSIALLDTALRRRFDFEELLPDVTLLSDNVDGVNVRAALLGLNSRIEYLFDRDHQIGHAYFQGCLTLTQIETVMRRKVIPLLIEYFYEDWEKVRVALNETQSDGAFILRRMLAARQTAEGEWEDDRRRWRYSIKPAFGADAFKQLA